MIPDLISELNEFQEYQIINPNVQDDGEGGQITVWIPGYKFMAAVTLDDTTDMLIAQAQGIKGNYSVTTHKNIRLPFHTVFRRISDGKTYRIVTDDEFATPASSSIPIRGNRAEEFVIPDE